MQQGCHKGQNYSEIGRVIADKLKGFNRKHNKNYTLCILADFVDIDYYNLCKFLRGRTNISIDTALRIALVMRFTATDAAALFNHCNAKGMFINHEGVIIRGFWHDSWDVE